MPIEIASLTLDRLSPVPLYFQIERLLKEQIELGSFAVGERLPAEPELAEQFAVSRSVVRQALARLEQDGLLRRSRGHGTFIAKPEHTWALEGAAGFFEQEVGRLGHALESVVLRAEAEVLPDWAAMLLMLPTGSTGVVLERLRSVEGALTLYDVNYLPEQFTDVVKVLRSQPANSLYDTLRRAYGLSVTSGRRVIDCVGASPDLARILEVDPGTPLLLVEGVDESDSHGVFDCYRTWVRPDRLKLEVRVGSSNGR
jgi:GntR family transcriptional regulator